VPIPAKLQQSMVVVSTEKYDHAPNIQTRPPFVSIERPELLAIILFHSKMSKKIRPTSFRNGISISVSSPSPKAMASETIRSAAY